MYEWWRRRKTGWHRPSPEYHGDCDGCSKNYRTGDDPVKRRYRTHVTSRSRKYRNLRAIASRNWQRVADRAKLLPALFALLSLLFSTAVPVFIPLGSGCHPQTSPKLPKTPKSPWDRRPSMRCPPPITCHSWVSRGLNSEFIFCVGCTYCQPPFQLSRVSSRILSLFHSDGRWTYHHVTWGVRRNRSVPAN